ncbi:MAG TPA: hypothetical protein VHV77_16355 [Pirellulales bacterium]|jgi:hypothetical protein|nr:hypothetical protein [Pirellulales bacterium]
MTPSSNDAPQGKGEPLPRNISADDIRRDSKLDRALLEHIVSHTRTADLEAMSEADRNALMQVVARLNGQAFSLTPVVTSMVEAVLPSAFKQLAGTSKHVQAMIADLSHTLFDDPIANARLAALWTELNKTKR